MNNPINSRRHDLDWLRVIAFGLLIFYHVGMYFVTWDWHVKSPYASAAIEPLMSLLNPWRLPLLFLISGVAVRFAADKIAPAQFAWLRIKRLSVPFVFGVFVIVAPQSYYELLYTGEIQPGYWAFYQGYLDFQQRWELFTPTYNHLWYVLYVLIYTILLIPFLGIIRRIQVGNILVSMLQSPAVIIAPAFLFVFYRFTSDVAWPETHDITGGDWGAHIRYGSYFLLGVMIAKNSAFWEGIARYWKWSAGLAFLSAIVLTVVWQNWGALENDGLAMNAARALRIFYVWWVITALLGISQHYLNRSSRVLSYLTEAVFPYYILHQTVIIVAGVWLSQFRLGGVAEFVGVIVITAGACLILHEFVIRRIGILRPLFGLKPKAKVFEGRVQVTT